MDDEASRRDRRRPHGLQTRHSGRLLSLVLQPITVCLIARQKQMLLFNSDLIPICLVLALTRTDGRRRCLRAAGTSVEPTRAKRDGMKLCHGHEITKIASHEIITQSDAKGIPP